VESHLCGYPAGTYMFRGRRRQTLRLGLADGRQCMRAKHMPERSLAIGDPQTASIFPRTFSQYIFHWPSPFSMLEDLSANIIMSCLLTIILFPTNLRIFKLEYLLCSQFQLRWSVQFLKGSWHGVLSPLQPCPPYYTAPL
jgi:hypothetical protein